MFKTNAPDKMANSFNIIPSDIKKQFIDETNQWKDKELNEMKITKQLHRIWLSFRVFSK